MVRKYSLNKNLDDIAVFSNNIYKLFIKYELIKNKLIILKFKKYNSIM